MANNSYKSLIKRWRENNRVIVFFDDYNFVNSVNYLDCKTQILNISVFALP